MAKVAVYIRWSSEDQGEGTTLQVQQETCLAYCERMGWQVPDDLIIVDDGYSGGNLHRPGMEQLRQAVQAGRVDTVVVYRLDRLSRDLAESTWLVGREWKGRAVLRSATEDVKPELDEGWLNYSFRAAFADYERRVIRQRTYSGKVRRLKEGLKANGNAPYGYRRTKKPGVYELDPDQSEVVRKIFEKCALENMGLPAIARWLNDMGYKTAKGYLWRTTSVRHLLCNPAYKGRIVFGRMKQLKQSSKDPGPWYRIQPPEIDIPADPGAFPRIVSDELWEHAQGALARRRSWMKSTSGRSLGSEHLLTGLLHCKCGSRMQLKQSGPSKRQIYRCVNHELVQRCPYDPGYIPVPVLDQVVINELLNRIGSDDFRKELDLAIEMQVQEEMSSLLTQRTSLEEELRGVNERLQFVDAEFLDRRITIEEARRFRARLDETKRALLERLAEVDTALGDHHRTLREKRSAANHVDLAMRWEELTKAQQRELLREFVVRIEALRSRRTGTLAVHIQWSFETDATPTTVRVSVPKHAKVKETLELLEKRSSRKKRGRA